MGGRPVAPAESSAAGGFGRAGHGADQGEQRATSGGVDSGGPLESLVAALGPGVVTTDWDVTDAYRRDRSQGPEPGRPLALARPTSTAEVSTLLRWAADERVAVVPRGAGTGLSGGSCAIDGCLVVSTEKMRDVIVDAPAGVAVAQPGALNVEVKQAAAAVGLWYPPDPSSFEICSIGGNVATNAGGLCCVRYGVTSDYVLGLEVVLAGGRILRLGGRTIKDVAGYDLKRLFVGSEGTLGIVTEVTLRLRVPPPPVRTAVATFAAPEAAGRAVTTIRRKTNPSMLEFMDTVALAAVEAATRMGLDAGCGALLLVAVDAGDGAAAAHVLDTCRSEGAIEVVTTEDPEEAEQLLAVRRMAITAIEKLGRVLIEDVGVPLDRIAELIGGVRAVAERRDTTVALIGHAGDGNFHPLLVVDPHDAEAVQRAEAAFGEIMELAVALGGTITGEHGVGTLKLPWLRTQVGEGALELARLVKQALDPLGIMNPGKAIS